ncbi:hypothetical protein P8C59_008321 [Phyllachora maydis]|uniref:F-box domain-containing protein n=1 Tax=Phyllachora maydis TaxID=1825666 RepID=A0AAD9MF29_9PEZI|nr:hypothetical protein P8C59_008321 [Phyllachora maydis]
MQPHSPSAQTSSSSFLRLPLELRLQIYRYLLVLPSSPRDLARRRNRYDRIHPAILSACAQTHDEAAPVLYGANTFAAHPALLTALPRLRPWHPPVPSPTTTTTTTITHDHTRLRRIRHWHLRIRLDGPTAPTSWPADAVAALDGADSVRVEAWQAVILAGAGVDALRGLEGVRGVRRARVLDAGALRGRG